jgi:hypothetical protein
MKYTVTKQTDGLFQVQREDGRVLSRNLTEDWMAQIIADDLSTGSITEEKVIEESIDCDVTLINEAHKLNNE